MDFGEFGDLIVFFVDKIVVITLFIGVITLNVFVYLWHDN